MKGRTVTLPPREIELKFQLLPGSEAILRAGDILGDAAQKRHQVTTYHDTSDNLLLTSGLSLRIRREKDGFLQTVKSRDNGIGLANNRKEWEWPVTSGTPHVEHLAAVSELASISGQITGRLAPVIVTDIWRTSCLHVVKGGCAAEASLDIGSVSSGEVSLPICELELELKGGEVAVLYRLALQLAETAPMWIGAESKSARGWSLRNGHGSGAVGLSKPKIAKRMSAAAGRHQIIGVLLGHLSANIPPTLSGDPEALRQMRGALRQLRTVFRLFAPLLNPDEIARLIAPLRQFARTFGTARDWDVFCVQTLPTVIKSLTETDWTDLSALADAERTAAHATVHDAICSPHLTHLILDLAVWSETCAATPRDIGAKQLTRCLAEIAPELLETFAEKAIHAGRHPGRLSMVALHDFRKALDRLNAAVRFLGSAYPKSAVADYRKRSDAVRDIIGAANDAEVTKALANSLTIGGSRNLSASIAALVTWADQRQAQSLTDLKPAAQRFRTASRFWLT